MFRVVSLERIRASASTGWWGLLLAAGCSRGQAYAAPLDSASARPATPPAEETAGNSPPRTSASTPEGAIAVPPPFRPTVENASQPTRPAPAGSLRMVWIPGGEFSMGAFNPDSRADAGPGDPTADSQPVHRVYVDGFWMDSTEVTNEAFQKFVRSTEYLTVAERTPTDDDFPDAPRESLIAGSLVFDPSTRPALDSHHRWWTYRKGASWQHPSGPASDLRGRERYPVVHVAYEDAVAYCRWAKKRLPTEAEFEFAARGGLSGKRYPWGDELRPGDRWMANVFQGHFPDQDTGDDGWAGVAPVASFPPNGYGLYDVAGNVWEWVVDWYRSDYYETFDLQRASRNPGGPEDSHDPGERGVAKRVQRGGSFLCASESCTRDLVGARGKGDPSSSASHVGFRCVAPEPR